MLPSSQAKMCHSSKDSNIKESQRDLCNHTVVCHSHKLYLVIGCRKSCEFTNYWNLSTAVCTNVTGSSADQNSFGIPPEGLHLYILWHWLRLLWPFSILFSPSLLVTRHLALLRALHNTQQSELSELQRHCLSSFHLNPWVLCMWRQY